MSPRLRPRFVTGSFLLLAVVVLSARASSAQLLEDLVEERSDLSGVGCYAMTYRRQLTADCPPQQELEAARNLARRVAPWGSDADLYDFYLELWDFIEAHPERENRRFRDLVAGYTLIEAIRVDNEELALSLVGAGAPLHLRTPPPRGFEDGGGWPALLFAASRGNSRLISILERSGANLRESDDAGRNALLMAARSSRDLPAHYGEFVRVIETLLDAGVDPYQEDAEGWNLFGYVQFGPGGEEEQPLLELLLGKALELHGSGGARLVYSLAYSGYNRTLVRALETEGPAAGWTDQTGAGPLALVARRSAPGAEDAIRRLVVGGAPVNARDLRGRTPLMEAVDADKVLSGEGGISPEVVRVLLELGADPRAVNRAGDSVRQIAHESVRNLIGE